MDISDSDDDDESEYRGSMACVCCCNTSSKEVCSVADIKKQYILKFPSQRLPCTPASKIFL